MVLIVIILDQLFLIENNIGPEKLLKINIIAIDTLWEDKKGSYDIIRFMPFHL
jgi:hypothetical protein